MKKTRFFLNVACLLVASTVILFFYFSLYASNDSVLEKEIIFDQNKLNVQNGDELKKDDEPVKQDSKEESEEEQDADDSSKHDDSVKSETKSNNSWLVNQNIVQYSVNAIIDNERNQVSIQGLIFVLNKVGNLEKFSEKLACLLKISDQPAVVVPATQVYDINKPLKKVVCDYKESLDLNARIQAAVFYQPESSDLLNSIKLVYQNVGVVDSSKEKLKTVAHCVYLTKRHLESEAKLENWLKMQQSVGINRIRLYFNASDTKVVEKLSETYKEFAQFINLNLNEQEFCAGIGEKEEAYKKCSEYYDLISRLESQHEQLSINDCYVKFRYNYELVSSFGIDDFLLPRLRKELNKLDTQDTCPQQSSVCEVFKVIPSYNLYTYASDLLNEFNASKTSSLSFKRLTYLKGDDQFFEKLSKYEANKTIEYSSDVKIQFQLESEGYSAKFSRASKFINCVENMFTEKSVESNNYNRTIMFNGDLHDIRSIFNTKNTETISIRSSDDAVKDTVKGEVRIESGNIAYFGDLMAANYENTLFKASQLDFDLDYYLFLVKNTNKLKC